VFRYLASWLLRLAEFFESTELRRAANSCVRWGGAKPIRSFGRNARISLAPEGRQDVRGALRPGYCGLPAWQCASAVAAITEPGQENLNGINFVPRHL
jgi:hypothetical protein